MAKKGIGKFVAFAAISGIVAAGVSYFLKYKSFHHELEEDFHDFEQDDKHQKFEEVSTEPAVERSYVSINTDRIEDDLETMTEAAKDTFQQINYKFDETKDSVKDTFEETKDVVSNTFTKTKEKIEDIVEPVAEQVKETITTIIEEDH